MARLPFLALALASLVAAILAGLFRLGWQVPIVSAASVPLHGALMICGFFGTLIGLERAVALGARWLYLWPVLAGISGLAAVSGAPRTAAVLATLAAASAVAGGVVLVRKQWGLATITQLLAAVAWFLGDLLWIARVGFATVSLWWIAFIVLTIAGERVELNRVLPPSRRARQVFVVVLAVVLVTLVMALVLPEAAQVFGAMLVALAAWLLVTDIARRNAATPGLVGYIATTLLGGYAWLAVGGVALALGGNGAGSPEWDAALHATLFGFAFSMVFAHAPIILPALVGARMQFSPAFHAHVWLLHASLVLRVAGDLLAMPEWRAWGGLGHVLAIVVFVGNTIVAVRRASGTAAGSVR